MLVLTHDGVLKIGDAQDGRDVQMALSNGYYLLLEEDGKVYLSKSFGYSAVIYKQEAKMLAESEKYELDYLEEAQALYAKRTRTHMNTLLHRQVCITLKDPKKIQATGESDGQVYGTLTGVDANFIYVHVFNAEYTGGEGDAEYAFPLSQVLAIEA